VSEDTFEAGARLRRAGEAYVLATVVGVVKPTSALPGAKAIVTAAGEWIGWIGGSCSRPTVAYEAKRTLASGRPKLIKLQSTETCASGGSLDIFLEPILPKPQLIIIGHLPVAQALSALGGPLGFQVTVMAPGGEADAFPSADRFLDDIDFDRVGPGRRHVVIASHGSYDEEALEKATALASDYIALVASSKRARALSIPEEVKCPAGLDIGAVSPAEIALSILAEIIDRRPALAQPPDRKESQEGEAKDPVCGMMVAVDATAQTLTLGDDTYYFCGRGCKNAYELEHAD